MAIPEKIATTQKRQVESDSFTEQIENLEQLKSMCSVCLYSVHVVLNEAVALKYYIIS